MVSMPTWVSSAMQPMSIVILSPLDQARVEHILAPTKSSGE